MKRSVKIQCTIPRWAYNRLVGISGREHIPLATAASSVLQKALEKLGPIRPESEEK